ncbi:CNBP [Mytilus coruscus]|uniref:CNBP n=1 Tax=Mytilus coruscus TaxID=42192 RepID=A0A6J8DNA3_MYTCO|nr:CNBP [Mytilus coruscus]
MSDITICGHISKFGDVVQGSIRRGLIKDTNIETGTRYVQLTNCIPIIPTATKFGRFSVRVFAGNNRTECPYCTKTDHQSYRCANKPYRQNQAAPKTYRFNSNAHTIKNCPHFEKLCYRCGKEGHIQRDCRADDQEMYGDYVHDIQEGRDANKDDSFIEDNNTEEGKLLLN